MNTVTLVTGKEMVKNYSATFFLLPFGIWKSKNISLEFVFYYLLEEGLYLLSMIKRNIYIQKFLSTADIF